MPSFQADLVLVPFAYREPLRAYCQEGLIPKQRTVLAACAGDFMGALETIDDPGDLRAILHFLHRHMSSATWGSPLRMANWEYVCTARAIDQDEVDDA